MEMIKHLEGLIPAPYTPMTPNDEINLSMIEKQAELFILNGIDTVYVCGSTGEGMSLTIDERMKVTQRWSEVAGDQFKIIINVGHSCLKDCQSLASFAQRCRIYGISAMPPCYYKPQSVEDLVAFYAAIAVAAPSTPFYAYHTPLMSGVTFPMIDFIGLASKQIQTLAGIKYNHNDLEDYKLCSEFDNGKYEVFFGVDELLLSALPLGMKAAIGSTYNYAVPLYRDIIKYYNQGDLIRAQKTQEKSVQLVNVLFKYGLLAAGKAIMRLLGADCGPTRLPIHRLSDSAFTDLCSELEIIGFFDYMSKPLGSGE